MQVVAKHMCLAAVAFLIGFVVQLYLRPTQVKEEVGRSCRGARPSERDAAGGPYRHGAVASDSAECSRIGRDTLVKGSVVDAAIATLLCLGVVQPHSLGLGGGFLMTVYNRDTGTSQVIDARETAPLASQEDMFAENPDLAVMGGISVAVPGQVRGLWEAHQRYGKLPWRDLFQPAVRLAEEGTCVGKHLARAMRVRKDDILDRKFGLRDVFCDEFGALLRENMTVKRPQLAKTLLAVANGVAEAFYTGKIAKNLVKEIQDNGGIITEQDLLDYRAEVTTSLKTSLPDGLILLTSGPPSGGSLLSLTLNILAGYGLSPSARESVYSKVLTHHRMFEAYKFSFAQGMALGDPNFVNVEELTKRMVSKDLADELRGKIDDTRTFDSSYYGLATPSPDIRGTSHVSVLGPNGDATKAPFWQKLSHVHVLGPNGDAVSATSSIGRFFGARFRSPSTGIIFNDHMDLFTVLGTNRTRIYSSSPGDTVQPGKRSTTSMSPTVVLDSSGDVRLVIGASGGRNIVTALADVIVHHLLLGMNISSAIEKPRLHLGVIEGVAGVDYEKGRPFRQKAVLHQLEKMHGQAVPNYHQAMVQAVARENSAIFAHSDSRKGGLPSGF
ncbi:GGT1 [Branchiostoma lanceolatum]|uniref:Glutathione hydrolase n=1 Tax=Branchiostoma lanceolatum TaxID=7740 RepID=A0A8J9VGI6_BRALA|nr:GGT1 [Branchiostoma lanceolatum]